MLLPIAFLTSSRLALSGFLSKPSPSDTTAVVSVFPGWEGGVLKKSRVVPTLAALEPVGAVLQSSTGSTDGSEPEPGWDVGSIGKTMTLVDISLMSVRRQGSRDPAFVQRRRNSPAAPRIIEVAKIGYTDIIYLFIDMMQVCVGNPRKDRDAHARCLERVSEQILPSSRHHGVCYLFRIQWLTKLVVLG